MRYVWMASIFLLLALSCFPASGFKPYCECADMGGQWATIRMLYENGQATSQTVQENMELQVTGCGVKGSFGAGGSISGSFAGGVANNLVGKWSMGGEEGTFQIELKDRDKDCAYFEGWMIKESGKKEWRWTGSRSTAAATSSCDAECRGRDPHQIWNGKDEYPYCNCACEPGWEFDSTGKFCVQAGTSNQNDAAQTLLTTPQGTTSIKPGGNIQITLANGESVSLEVFCRELDKKIKLMAAIYGTGEGARMSMADISLAMGFLNAYENLCRNRASADMASYDTASDYFASYDSAPSGSTDAPSLDIKIEIREGPLDIEVLNDMVSLEVMTPAATISSQGMNSFGVAYDPESGKSYVTAYQYPVQVRPMDGSQASFTLESGQKVEVGNGQVTATSPSGQPSSGQSSSGQSPPTQPQGEEMPGSPGYMPEGSEGGCYADPVTGEIVCVDATGEPSGDQGGMQGGCYEDPATGQFICVD